jgi:hypothetical protein
LRFSLLFPFKFYFRNLVTLDNSNKNNSKVQNPRRKQSSELLDLSGFVDASGRTSRRNMACFYLPLDPKERRSAYHSRLSGICQRLSRQLAKGQGEPDMDDDDRESVGSRQGEGLGHQQLHQKFYSFQTRSCPTIPGRTCSLTSASTSPSPPSTPSSATTTPSPSSHVEFPWRGRPDMPEGLLATSRRLFDLTPGAARRWPEVIRRRSPPCDLDPMEEPLERVPARTLDEITIEGWGPGLGEADVVYVDCADEVLLETLNDCEPVSNARNEPLKSLGKYGATLWRMRSVAYVIYFVRHAMN